LVFQESVKKAGGDVNTVPRQWVESVPGGLIS
jgi:hypothetical protein